MTAKEHPDHLALRGELRRIIAESVAETLAESSVEKISALVGGRVRVGVDAPRVQAAPAPLPPGMPAGRGEA